MAEPADVARMHMDMLQNVPELHVGLRTGYCGSLTTFASWEYSLVTGLIGGAPTATRLTCSGDCLLEMGSHRKEMLCDNEHQRPFYVAES